MKTQTSTLAQMNQATQGVTINGYSQQFLAFAARMDFYRLPVLVATILIQGCITAPFTIWSMQLVNNYSTVAMAIVTLSSFAILVSNLSVQPMHVTLPVFAISILAQIGLIVNNVLAIL